MSIHLQPFTPLFTPISSTNSSIANCNICYNIYDIQDHFPLIICSNKHSICKYCLQAMRRSLFCPFCRLIIQPNRILKNKEVINYLQGKQIRSNRAENNEILNTEFEQNQENQYIDPISIFGRQPIVSLIEEHQSYQHKILNLVIFIQLVLLQLPLGIYSLYLAFKQQNSSCLAIDYFGNNLTLNEVMISLGYSQFSIGCMLFFILIQHLLIFRQQYQNMYFFISIITFISILKSFISAIIYSKYIISDFYTLCSQFYMHGLINFICQYISIFIGFFLFVILLEKLCNRNGD